MDDKIIIVGTGNDAALGAKIAMCNVEHSNLIMITPDEAKQLAAPENKPFVITNPHPVGGYFTGGKQFVCKGKHEYREVKNESDGYIIIKWVCQCGRQL